VLNPPKVLQDPDGRDVVISHSGAFAKFLGRLDLVVRDDPQYGGKRVVSHKYQVFPVDERLAAYEHLPTSEMLVPYVLELNQALDLRRVIGYAPLSVTRRSATGHGDSELGNLVAESMRSRRRVAAEIAVTNTLGIRDNFYPGPITLEDMFNVFPFENTLVVMYLSGRELLELTDFITNRSAGRGCQSQAQVAGFRFTMNCGQVLANERDGTNVQTSEAITIGTSAGGPPLSLDATYKIATNDYIANGGSGFRVLKRNTTKIDTGVALRDALIDHIGTLPSCGAYEAALGHACLGSDDTSKKLCEDIVDCEEYAKLIEDNCTQAKRDALPEVCKDVVDSSCEVSGNVKGPFADVPCVIGKEDGRIRRKTAEGLDEIDDQEEEEPQP
jgi:5'-nucleotidase / UDP-sugar diphosphatase